MTSLAERRSVSRFEWFSELGKLSGKIRRRRRLRSEYFSLMRGIRPLVAEIRELEARRIRYPPVSVVERAYITRRLEEVAREREHILAEMRHIRTTELAVLDEEIDRERREIAKKIPPPPAPPEELIGDESCSGYDIWFDLTDNIYRIRDPDTKELIREEDKIAVALTASIRTGKGHDVPIALEITAVTYITEMSLSEIVTLEKNLERTTMNWLRQEGWGALLPSFEKIGVELNGETHVDHVGLYPFSVPDHPEIHFYVERRSRYIKKRTYQGEMKE